MVKLRILEILESQNHTKYWLFKQLDLSYQNFNRMVNNETSSIRFENLYIRSSRCNQRQPCKLPGTGHICQRDQNRIKDRNSDFFRHDPKCK